NVVNLSAIQQPVSKVMLCEPTSYNEVQEIADNLLNKRAVVINMQRVDHSQAKRIVDFLSGTVYAGKGDIQKLGAGTFLCTPDNIDVSGPLSDLNMVQAHFCKGRGRSNVSNYTAVAISYSHLIVCAFYFCFDVL